MVELLIGFVAGLLVGWNLLPQPEWISKWFKSEPTDPVE